MVLLLPPMLFLLKHVSSNVRFHWERVLNHSFTSTISCLKLKLFGHPSWTFCLPWVNICAVSISLTHVTAPQGQCRGAFVSDLLLDTAGSNAESGVSVTWHRFRTSVVSEYKATLLSYLFVLLIIPTIIHTILLKQIKLNDYFISWTHTFDPQWPVSNGYIHTQLT